MKIEKAVMIFKKWKNDYVFKTMASALLSFSCTVIFALYNGFLGIYMLSVWHGSICVFYLLLAAIRGMILLTEKKNGKRSEGERVYTRQKIFIISSAMLFALNLALILPAALMVVFKKPINMGLIPAIAMAAYTTYKLTMASVHIRKQKRSGHNNVLITELRTINFIDALVSVLTLQNTLIMVNQAKSNADDMAALSAVSSAAIYSVNMLITIRLLMAGLKLGRSPERRGLKISGDLEQDESDANPVNR